MLNASLFSHSLNLKLKFSFIRVFLVSARCLPSFPSQLHSVLSLLFLKSSKFEVYYYYYYVVVLQIIMYKTSVEFSNRVWIKCYAYFIEWDVRKCVTWCNVVMKWGKCIDTRAFTWMTKYILLHNCFFCAHCWWDQNWY